MRRIMWELYDALLAEIPQERKIESVLLGESRCLVRAQNTGISTLENTACGEKDFHFLCGRPLSEAASLVKSWDFTAASVGMAAVNAYYNDYDLLKKIGAQIWPPLSHGVGDVFEDYREKIAGKNVAMIGHFDYAAKWMKDICRLSIFERDPSGGDYPDSAEEYLLPEQEFVFITGMTFTNKTLPRLLALSHNAETILVGPSVPAAPILFEYGVDCISSLCVRDAALAEINVKSGICKAIYESGSKLILHAPV